MVELVGGNRNDPNSGNSANGNGGNGGLASAGGSANGGVGGFVNENPSKGKVPPDREKSNGYMGSF